jgi:hypothetical protein
VPESLVVELGMMQPESADTEAPLPTRYVPAQIALAKIQEDFILRPSTPRPLGANFATNVLGDGGRWTPTPPCA